ncbi:MAG: non-ribosomal peptide synthetase, partial [Hapalosiphonaceae cyanobacterium JJU2]
QVVEALQPQRSLSHTPLFQVIFDMQNAPMGEIELSGMALRRVEQERIIAKFDLTLFVSETANGLVGVWEYSTDLFDASTIERMTAHFENLLLAVAESPQQTIGEIPLLSDAERHQLLFEWNDTAREYSKDKCIHQLFEEQVEQTPDAVAVVFEEQQLTYRQLNERANQLAHHLKTLGVEPEVLVGICIERSLEMVVGLLGILKAGGAYVPLDPSYPTERLALMIEDSQIPILITQEQLAENLPTTWIQVLLLEEELWPTLLSIHPQYNPMNEVTANHLAYVIYTSGSTGTPKGTMVLHQGLVNYLSWCTDTYAVADLAGAIVHSSLSFDATVTALFAPLIVGKVVCLLPERETIEHLASWLSKNQKPSLVKITPAHLDVLAQISPVQSLNTANTFVIGGEVLKGNSLSLWSNSPNSTRFINEYGPTETVVGCCIYEVSTTEPLAESLPIGRPIFNTQIYILDSHLQLVPIGV